MDVPSDEEDELKIQHFHEMELDDRILKVSRCRMTKIVFYRLCHIFV